MREYDEMAAALVAGVTKVRDGIHLMTDPELLTHGPNIVEALQHCVNQFPAMDTRSRVAAFTAEGRTPREIAGLLDVSTQAVYQHLKRLEIH